MPSPLYLPDRLPCPDDPRYAQAKGVCALCGEPVDGFRDASGEREYRVSGMCQECQDKVFGE